MIAQNHSKMALLQLLPRLIPLTRNISSCSILMEKLDQDKFQKQTQLKAVRDSRLVSKELFEDAKAKNRETFKGALEIFKNRDVRRRGSVEFIRAAMKHMKDFGVEKDLEVYKALVDVMPKGIYPAQNVIQAGFFHYPKQQECLLDVLVQMSENKVTPDREMGQLLQTIIGIDSTPYRKFARMRYWDSKFSNLNPFPLPLEMPNDALELAKMAIERISSVDRATKIQIYDTEFDLDPEFEAEKSWIVSGISPAQKKLLSTWPKKSTLYVEGAFRVWLRGCQVNYFILRGESRPKRPEESKKNVDDLKRIRIWTHTDVPEDEIDELHLSEPSVHEQDDGTILACCATETSSKDSLLSWVRLLEKEIPNMDNLQILFTIKQAWSPIKPISPEELSLEPKQ